MDNRYMERINVSLKEDDTDLCHEAKDDLEAEGYNEPDAASHQRITT